MSARTYRLAPQDRTGVWMGLGWSQLAAAAAGLMIAIVAWNTRLPAVIGFVALGLAGGVATGRWQGRPVVEAAPDLARAAKLTIRPRRAGWLADLFDPGLPAPLRSQRLVEVDAAMFGHAGHPGSVAVVHDDRTGLWAATLRVEGTQFALASAVDQDRLLALWGDALAPFSRERSPIAWVRWSEWSAPSGDDAHQAWLDDHLAAAEDDPALLSYRDVQKTAAPTITGHEVLITIAVNEHRCGATTQGTRRARGERSRATARHETAVEVLAREIRLFGGRLQSAGLRVTGPLSTHQLSRAVAVRFDPSRATALDAVGRRLAERAGVVEPDEMGTDSSEAAARYWRAGASFHRGLWVKEWPRGEVRADWMAQLMLFVGPIRAISVFAEPVAPSVSRRAIESQAAKLDSDAEQRTRTGFRVGAPHRRQRESVEDREAELVAGYAEQTYVGIIDVAADTEDRLDLMCAELTQAGAACGLEMRPLWWRHDQVAAASLPLAYGLAQRPTLS